MRIALFSDTYLPQKNGVAVAVNQLKYELTKLGHDVYVYTIHIPNDSESELEEQVMRSRAILVPRLGADENLLALPSRHKTLRQLKLDRIEVIHTHTELPQGFLGRQCAKALNIPHIHTVHTMWSDYRHYLFRGRLLTRRNVELVYHHFLKKNTAVIAPSVKAKEFLDSIDIRSVHINNGVDAELFLHGYDEQKVSSLRKAYKLSEDTKVLIFVGRIAPEKRAVELFELLTPLLKKNPKVAMIFVGEGVDAAQLKERAHELALAERFIFAGRIGHEQMANYYALAYAYVTISLSEVQPMTLIEALLSSLPIISRKDSAYTGLVQHNVNGGQYDTDELVLAAIEQLLKDDALHQRYAQASRQIAGSFTAERNACATAALYERAIEAGRPEAFQKGPLVYDE